MVIPPKYILTPTISRYLQVIEAAKSVIETIKVPLEVEINVRRQTTLKSSLYSARIEGNPLVLEDLPHRSSKDQKKREVFNILRALEFIYARALREIELITILQIHQKIMNELDDKAELSVLRRDMNAIFNSAGVAIYLPPPPSEVEPLLIRLIEFINGESEEFVPIRAILAHYIFEKIHPFIDGNGRVGRVLLQLVLVKGGFGMKGLLNIEEYFDKNRSEYYNGLMEPEKDVTEYVEFILRAMASTADRAKALILSKQRVQAEDYLLPRRAEIYRIIKDQKLINFDSLRRRFMQVNERTLRYDLKKLAEGGLIRKRGTTKGVYYEVA